MFEPHLEREFLLQNVQSFPANAIGSPSILYVSGNTAFPVIIESDTQNVLIAASVLETGRIIMSGVFLDEAALGNEQMLPLVHNSIHWTNNQEDPPKILAKDVDYMADLLAEQGFEVEKTARFTEENLERCTVIICNVDSIDEGANELSLLENAFKNGKGAVLIGLGWVWQDENRDKSLKRDYIGNRLLSTAGIEIIYDGFADNVVFQADVELLDWLTYEQAKSFVLENDCQTNDRKMLAKCLRMVMDTISRGGQENFAIHTDFPPNPTDAMPVSKEITIDTKNAHWNSTGLYAQAGENIVFHTQDAFPISTFKIRIGAHTDWLYDVGDKWERMPEISVCFELQQGETIVFNPFGGTIYIEVPENYQGDNLYLTISGAVEAPFFKLGETSLEDWNEYIRHFPATFGEIVGNEFAITIRSEYLRNLENPHEVAEFWDNVQAANRTLSNWRENVSHNMRIVFDKQISMGYMHSGYPVMAFIGQEEENVLNLQNTNKWGFFHELGHNHQVPAWDFEGSEEVTCNVFTLYVMEHVVKISIEELGVLGFFDLMPDYLNQKWKEYEENEKSFKIWQDDPFFALSTYRQLIKYYGWESIIHVFDAYHHKTEAELPQNNQQKMDMWLKTYSEVVQEDLSDFFDAWNIPISQEIKEELAALPKANPEELLVFENI